MLGMWTDTWMQVVRRGQLLIDVHVPMTVSTVAKKRWVSLRALAHGFKASSVGTWKSVIAGAKVAVELKQLLNFQRSSAQANSVELSSMSTSDLIVSFVKDSVPATFMRCVFRHVECWVVCARLSRCSSHTW